VTPESSRWNNAVANCREIFDQNPSATRREAIAAATEAGINPATAKTQYERWQRQRRTPEPAPSTGNPPGPHEGE